MRFLSDFSGFLQVFSRLPRLSRVFLCSEAYLGFGFYYVLFGFLVYTCLLEILLCSRYWEGKPPTKGRQF